MPHRTKKALLLLASVLVCGALLEGFSYVLVSQLDNELGNRSQRHLYSPLRGHELNADYRRGFDTGAVRVHSDQGFRRDGRVALPKPPGTFRIFVLGGSALYGVGVQSDDIYPRHPALLNEQTIPGVLERLLNEEFRTRAPDLDFEVINAGVIAYHTFHHVLYVFETLFAYEPDMLVFVDGHNDFYNLTTRNPIKEYGYSTFAMLPALNQRKPWVTLYIAARLLGQYSYFFKAVEQLVYKLFETYEGRPNNIRVDYAAVRDDIAGAVERSAQIGFLRNYRLIETLGAEHGFTFRVFLQPEVVFEDDNLLGEHDRTVRRITERTYGPDRVVAMREARKQFPQLFATAGIPFTDMGDLATPATREQKLYMDYCHLMPQGSEVAALRMLPALVDDIELQLGLGPDLLSLGPARSPSPPEQIADELE